MAGLAAGPASSRRSSGRPAGRAGRRRRPRRSRRPGTQRSTTPAARASPRGAAGPATGRPAARRASRERAAEAAGADDGDGIHAEGPVSLGPSPKVTATSRSVGRSTRGCCRSHVTSSGRPLEATQPIPVSPDGASRSGMEAAERREELRGRLRAGAGLHPLPAAGREPPERRLRLRQRGRRRHVPRRGARSARGRAGAAVRRAGGRLLRSCSRRSACAREDVFIANTLFCRPPGNRDPLPAGDLQLPGLHCSASSS